MIIIGIDPGPDTSGFVVYSPSLLSVSRAPRPTTDMRNDDISFVLEAGQREMIRPIVAVESVAVYQSTTRCPKCGTKVYGGSRASKGLIEMSENIGAWRQIVGPERFHTITRPEVVRHFVGSTSGSSQALVRQAIIDRFGGSRSSAVGGKKNPGPLYGVKGHAWEALAVALAVADRLERGGTT